VASATPFLPSTNGLELIEWAARVPRWNRPADPGMVSIMADSVNEDPERQSLPDILVNLPAVRVAKQVNTSSRINRRLIQPIEIKQDNDDPRLAFQHTVLCQTSWPYRDPGDDVREWKRINGSVALQVQAGDAWNPAAADFVRLGLPWGTKPRLILAHLNAEALRQGSPVIEVESSLSAFVKRIRGFQHGREIRAFKDQMSRLSVATVRLATTRGARGFQINSQVITGFELWPERDERQRLLWPATIQLSLDYFASLQEHAVPLNEADLAALAHSAMALDLYAWLAQRLHRIDPHRPAFIQWPALMQQFGPDYGRMSHFKPKFCTALQQVLTRYRAARVEADGHGLRLHNSPPPVPRRLIVLSSRSRT
jgi:hypothetical protein